MDYSIKNNYTRGKYSSAGTTYVSLAKQQRRKAAHLIWVFYSQEEGDDQDQYCQRRQIFEKTHRPSFFFFFSIFSSVANSASFIQLSHFSSPFFFRGWLMLPKKTNGGREEGKSQGGETQKFDDDENKVASKAWRFARREKMGGFLLDYGKKSCTHHTKHIWSSSMTRNRDTNPGCAQQLTNIYIYI